MRDCRNDTRADYRHFLEIPTRWMDNDSYGHVNNVTYYSYFDTVVNEHLIRAGNLDIRNGPVVGFVVETSCSFYRPLSFPETDRCGHPRGEARAILGDLRDRTVPEGERDPRRRGTLRPRVGRSRDRDAGRHSARHPRRSGAAGGGFARHVSDIPLRCAPMSAATLADAERAARRVPRR